MAYFNIGTDKKGRLTAKLQAYGIDPATNKSKIFYRRVTNFDNLSPAKFRKYVERCAMDFEQELSAVAEMGGTVSGTQALPFYALAEEWIENIRKNLSKSYYARAKEVIKKFNDYLKENQMYYTSIKNITVRHVQMFLNSFGEKTIKSNVVKLKKPLPKTINFRELDRRGIITRNSAYRLTNAEGGVLRETAETICNLYKLNFDEYFLPQVERKYAVETIKGYRRMLRTVFNEAVRYDWIVKNPVCSTKIAAVNGNVCLREVGEKEVFSIEEAQRFIKELDMWGDEVIYRKVPIKFMIMTGVRVGELRGLLWSDIDFEKKEVHIQRSRLNTVGFGVYEKEPKTKTSIRTIPLPDALIADLEEYKNWFRQADKNFDKHLHSTYIASNIYREPVAGGMIGKWLSDFETKKGFKHISCHGLRHTYCSLLLSQNVPITTVSKYLGHSDTTVTLQVYTHFVPDTQVKVINAFENLFS